MTSVQRRILIVEDEWLLAVQTEDVIRAAGCLVVGPVMSVAHALALVARDGIDAAVLDVNLDREMSYPIAEALMDRDIPFAFATGFVADDLPEKFRFCRLLSKPVRAEALISALGLA